MADVQEPTVLKHTINDKTRSIVKVVEMPLNEDFIEPDGYILKDIYNAENKEGGDRFYAVLVKIQEVMQGQISRMPATKPVDLKEKRTSEKKSK